MTKLRAYLCDCNPAAQHRIDCPASAILADVVLATKFNPWSVAMDMARPFWNTWICAVHGLVGDINGPVHMETCSRHLPEWTKVEYA